MTNHHGRTGDKFVHFLLTLFKRWFKACLFASIFSPRPSSYWWTPTKCHDCFAMQQPLKTNLPLLMNEQEWMEPAVSITAIANFGSLLFINCSDLYVRKSLGWSVKTIPSIDERDDFVRFVCMSRGVENKLRNFNQPRLTYP